MSKKTRPPFKQFSKYADDAAYNFYVDVKGNICSPGGTIQLTAKQALKVLKDHTEHAELHAKYCALEAHSSDARRAMQKANREYEAAKTNYALSESAFKTAADISSQAWKEYSRVALTTTSCHSITHCNDQINVGCNRVPLTMVKRIVALCCKLAKIKNK